MEPIILGSQTPMLLEYFQAIGPFIAVGLTAYITWKISDRRIKDDFVLHKNRILWDIKLEFFKELNDFGAKAATISNLKEALKFASLAGNMSLRSIYLFDSNKLSDALINHSLKSSEWVRDKMDKKTEKLITDYTGGNLEDALDVVTSDLGISKIGVSASERLSLDSQS